MATAPACFICLDTSPPPIQSGCACRGDSGFAHIGCLVLAAEAYSQNGRNAAWSACRTCKQSFTGAMQFGLAEAWWSRVRNQPVESEARLDAATNLAASLCHNGRYAEAEQMQLELLAV